MKIYLEDTWDATDIIKYCQENNIICHECS